MAKAPSSYIKTTTAAATRQTDLLYWTVPVRPQAMTVYLRFIEVGAILATASQFLINIGGTGTPQFNIVQLDGDGVYRVRHFSGNGAVQCAMSAAPTVGQSVELCGQLFATGAVQLHQSLDRAGVTSGTASAALALAPQWGAATVALGSNTSQFIATIGVRDVLIIRGVHDLATMRQRAGLA